MKKAPALVEDGWSPLLKKVSACKEITYAVADFLLQPFAKRDQHDEVQGLLAQYVPNITPSTVWFLEQHAQFTSAKNQQLNRLKATFVVHDRFENNVSHLINLASNLKSPAELIDTFLKAVTRSKKPLAYQALMDRYHPSL